MVRVEFVSGQSIIKLQTNEKLILSSLDRCSFSQNVKKHILMSPLQTLTFEDS